MEHAVGVSMETPGDDEKKPVKQIVFEGERSDVMSVRRWRDRLLGGEGKPLSRQG